MTRLEDRRILMAGIAEACAAGARLAPACSLAGIDLRTFQRWHVEDGEVRADRRPEAVRPRPMHALGAAERARIVALANAPRFASTPPARIVPALADEGVYVASEASFHRVLRDQGQMRRRGRARPPRSAGPPSTHVGDRSGAGLVLGRDLPAQAGAGALVLPVPHPRPLQPQGRRLRGPHQ
jgi:putative transposase